MRTVSAAYTSAYQNNFVYSSRIQVLNREGSILRDSLDATAGFDVVGGRVEVDYTAAIRRRLSGLKIVDVKGSLFSSGILSTTSGNRIKVWAGLGTELFTQGVFDIESTDARDSAFGLVLTVNGYDGARSISRAKLTKPYTITHNSNVVTAIQDLLNDYYRRTGVPITYSVVGTTGHQVAYQLVEPQADVWDLCMDIAESAGMEIFFDTEGNVVIQGVLDPNNPNLIPSWQYLEGVTATVTEVIRASSNEDVPNYVIVSGENAYNITPPRGAAWDSNVLSPTYAGNPEASPPVAPGRYGLVPDFIVDDKATTNAQATASAQSRLNRRIGATETLSFRIVPNPAHVEGDVVNVQRALTALNANVIIDNMSIPLVCAGGQDMTITTRTRRL